MRLAYIVAFGVLLTATLDAASWRPSNPESRIRPAQPAAERLLADGIAGSPTFRRLVQRIEASDLIVYVDLRPDLPDAIAGTTRFMASSANGRSLLIRMNRMYGWQTLVSLLGHELRHAVEVADAPEIRSSEAFTAYYRGLGVRLGNGRFDSEAAQEAGRAVRAELSASDQDTRLASARPRSDRSKARALQNQ